VSPSPTPNVLVIGGGISGLACAHRLQRDDFAVQLLESGKRFGGVLDTIEKDSFRFDVGPQSFLANAAMMELIEELGLSGELLRADPRAPRYILLGGRLVAAPLGPGSLIRTPLISWRTKFRLLTEPLSRTYPPDGDESIAAFIRRKFGDDLLTNLAGPFISGVYAGDPEKLSLTSTFPIARTLEEKFGSLIRGAIKMRRQASGGGRRPPRPSLCNFRKGTQALVNALATALGESAHRAATVAAIRGNGPGQRARFTVTFQDSGAMQSLTASAIVFATPARQAGGLLRAVRPQFPDLLAQIEYAPVAQVAAGYRVSQIPRFRASAKAARGFGFLVPRTEGLRLLGTVWNSFLFPERAPEAPEKMASFTSFAGGATDPEIVSRPENEVAAIVHKELAGVLGITGEPVTQYIARWERALPQYNLGHSQVVAALGELCAATPGVFLTGNYLSGPSMGACVEHATKTANAVAQFLRAQP
jgi:oxygen-dependent protoporphyrinogen oxidase